MGHQLIEPVRASVLAEAIGLRVTGTDAFIDSVRPLDEAASGALSFSKSVPDHPLPENVILIGPTGFSTQSSASIEAGNPRLAFAKALHWLQVSPGFRRVLDPPQVHPEARVSRTAVLGTGVRIGKGTVIHHFVVIGEGVHIGDHCVIKSGSVIGEDGFGFERDENGIPVRIPHLGSVRIGSHVEIGSLNTVCKGALTDTLIEDDVKTDDHVHIAHNCRIGRGTLLTSCVALSGGVDIGQFAWIGPNSSVIQKVRIGDHALIGIGSSVMKTVDPGTTVAGNPARIFVKKASGS